MSTEGIRIGRPLPDFETIDAVDLEIADHQRRAVLDDAGLRGGAAHVERQQPIEAEHLGVIGRGEARPAAGPDSTMRTGKRLATSMPMTPAVGQHDQRIVDEARAGAAPGAAHRDRAR